MAIDKKIHLGYVTAAVSVFIIAATFLSISGFLTETEVSRLAARTPAEINYQPSGRVAGVAVEVAKITIDRPAGNSLSLEFQVFEEMTVLDAVREIVAFYGLDLQTKEYDGVGTLVEAIGDLAGGDNDKYWTYYVNGEMALVAADRLAVRPGDRIEFRFESSPF